MADPMSKLFSPLHIGNMELTNRIFVGPMCQYSARNGLANDWHRQHLGGLAVGGAGAITIEATAVVPEGRITPGCLGLYTDEQEASFTSLLGFMRNLGSGKIGLQLGHAGRKASCRPPWEDGQGLTETQGAWQTLAPSAIPFGSRRGMPAAATEDDLERIAKAFADSARRADRAGFDYVEVHGAHGYLLSSFLSPISNRREDSYGGSLENRMRFPLDVVARVRAAWPAHKPLGIRINAHDWVEGGLEFADTMNYVHALKAAGIDFICISAGAIVEGVKIPATPGYLTKYTQQISKDTGLITRAVGLIHDPRLAEEIVGSGQADCVAVARAMLFDPRWAYRAAQALNVDLAYPPQYALTHPRIWKGPRYYQ